MNHLGNKYLNLNFLNEKLDNRFIIETNINNAHENSDKVFSFEENQICMPHLIEKCNCFKSEINDKNKEIVDDKNNTVLSKGKSPKKNIDEDETFDVKTIFFEKKNKLGRKRKGENYDNNNEEHDKFSNDNITRKVKRIIFTHLLKYLNKQIKIKYNGKIGKGVFKKELYFLNQAQILNSSVNFNKALLQKTLYDIFSEKISSRITNYPEDHNKEIIEGLINEKDTEKRIYFKNLFSLTFSDCLEYLKGEKHFEQLNGLELFSEFKEIKQDYLKKYNDGEEYVKLLKYCLKEYKNIINNKSPRESSKKRAKKKKKI
jgi:hypothetical protein